MTSKVGTPLSLAHTVHKQKHQFVVCFPSHDEYNMRIVNPQLLLEPVSAVGLTSVETMFPEGSLRFKLIG